MFLKMMNKNLREKNPLVMPFTHFGRCEDMIKVL